MASVPRGEAPAQAPAITQWNDGVMKAPLPFWSAVQEDFWMVPGPVPEPEAARMTLGRFNRP